VIFVNPDSLKAPSSIRRNLDSTSNATSHSDRHEAKDCFSIKITLDGIAMTFRIVPEKA
jgi:hypothetical protein